MLRGGLFPRSPHRPRFYHGNKTLRVCSILALLKYSTGSLFLDTPVDFAMHDIFKAVSSAGSSVQGTPLPLVCKSVLSQAACKHLEKRDQMCFMLFVLEKATLEEETMFFLQPSIGVMVNYSAIPPPNFLHTMLIKKKLSYQPELVGQIHWVDPAVDV